MLIPLGILAAQTGELGSYDLLETVSLASSAASVTFSNLNTYASTYQHLQIRGVAVTPLDSVRNWLRINGSTGTYWSHVLQGADAGAGNTVESLSLSETYIRWGFAYGSGSVLHPLVIDILDPYETNKNTTVRGLTGNPGAGNNNIGLVSGLYSSTTAVDSITLGRVSANYSQGSRFSLYGIKG